MPASLMASFLVFFLTGLYVFWIVGSGVTGSFLADVFIYPTLMANAVYFYYFEAFAEIDATEHARLASKPVLEWYLRVFNHAILISLWLALEQDFVWFLLLWILFYLLMLSWDYLTRDRLSADAAGNPVQANNRPSLPKWDVIGLVLTFGFLADVRALKEIMNDGPYKQFLISLLDSKDPLIFGLGGMCLGYIWLIRNASRGLNFRLRDHFRRPNLR